MKTSIAIKRKLRKLAIFFGCEKIEDILYDSTINEITKDTEKTIAKIKAVEKQIEELNQSSAEKIAIEEDITYMYKREQAAKEKYGFGSPQALKAQEERSWLYMKTKLCSKREPDVRIRFPML